jgi:hypothetical protein
MRQTFGSKWYLVSISYTCFNFNFQDFLFGNKSSQIQERKIFEIFRSNFSYFIFGHSSHTCSCIIWN